MKNALFEGYDKKHEIRTLLNQSAKDLGLNTKLKISESERQALLFHFCKFTLTDHIIKTLKPTSFNMSCKDGVDRGGAASAYYNLIKSIELLGIPLTEDEFNRAVDAAAAMVKGRGMNHHKDILWNAINNYVEADSNKLPPDWLNGWLSKNNPHDKLKFQLESLKNLDKDCYISHQKLLVFIKAGKGLGTSNRWIDSLKTLPEQEGKISGKAIIQCLETTATNNASCVSAIKNPKNHAAARVAAFVDGYQAGANKAGGNNCPDMNRKIKRILWSIGYACRQSQAQEPQMSI